MNITSTRRMLDDLVAAGGDLEQQQRTAAEAKATARAAGRDPVKAEAARLLGARYDEITDVRREQGRLIITAKSSPPVVFVPSDAPDADGKTGLMLWQPTRHRTALPVYARTATMPHLEVEDLADELEPEAAPEPAAEPGWYDDIQRALDALIVEIAEDETPYRTTDANWRKPAILDRVQRLARWRAARRTEAWEVTHPPAPDAYHVAFARSMLELATTVAAASDERERRRLLHEWTEAHPAAGFAVPLTVDRLLAEHARGAFQSDVDSLERQIARSLGTAP